MPKKHRYDPGGVSSRTPRDVGISLQMQAGRVVMRCPHCRQVLYSGPEGTPHAASERMMRRHIGACAALAKAMKEAPQEVGSGAGAAG